MLHKIYLDTILREIKACMALLVVNGKCPSGWNWSWLCQAIRFERAMYVGGSQPLSCGCSLQRTAPLPSSQALTLVSIT